MGSGAGTEGSSNWHLQQISALRLMCSLLIGRIITGTNNTTVTNYNDMFWRFFMKLYILMDYFEIRDHNISASFWNCTLMLILGKLCTLY